jgi:hypothetical protein
MANGLNLSTLEEGIKDKSSIGKHVTRDRVCLLHTARIWQVSLTHARIADVVIRAIRLAVRVFGSNVRRRGVREVIINCVKRIRSSGKSRTRIQYNKEGMD